MNDLKKSIGMLVVIIGFLCLFAFFYRLNFDMINFAMESVDKQPVSEETEEQPVPQVAVLGDGEFHETDQVKLRPVAWGDELPEDLHYVLVSKEEDITPEKKETLQRFVKEGHIVLLAGLDVSFEYAKEFFDYTIEPFDLGSNLPYNMVLYGYGYSDEHQKNMPLFHGAYLEGIEPNELDETIDSVIYDYILSLETKSSASQQ